MKVKTGDIIQVPAGVMFRKRVGSSRWNWKPALVTKVYNAKGGPAVEVNLENVTGSKFLVSKCKKMIFTVPASEKSNVPTEEIIKWKYGKFFDALELEINDYKNQIEDYRNP